MRPEVATLPESGYIPPPMEGRQVKAARVMLGWSQTDLCKQAGISRATLLDIENDTGDPRRSSITAVEHAFAKAGVSFFEDGSHVGVRASKRRR